jgi:hypothetical protein
LGYPRDLACVKGLRSGKSAPTFEIEDQICLMHRDLAVGRPGAAGRIDVLAGVDGLDGISAARAEHVAEPGHTSLEPQDQRAMRRRTSALRA